MPKKTDKDILKRNLIEALRSSLGVIAAACKKVGCSRQTYYDFMKDDPDFASSVDGIKEEAIDFAEGQLLKLMNNENVTAIIFYLKTQGKKRGYIERVENDLTSLGKSLVSDIDYSKLSDSALAELAKAKINKSDAE